MNQILKHHVDYKTTRGDDFKLIEWSRNLDLKTRFNELSRNKVKLLKRMHETVFWGRQPNGRWHLLMTGGTPPNVFEALLFCTELDCTLLEFMDPNFSFADREAEIRHLNRKQEVQNLYGLRSA